MRRTIGFGLKLLMPVVLLLAGTRAAQGAGGYAVFFTGTNAYAEVPMTDALNIATNSFTIEMWYKADKTNYSARLPLISCTTNYSLSKNYGYSLEIYHDRFMYQGIFYSSIGKPLTTDVWHHVAISVYQTPGHSPTGYIYHNGWYQRLVNLERSVSSNAPLTIGSLQYDDDTRYYFDGWIAELRVWNEARTTDEIMANRYVLKDRNEHLVAYYPMYKPTANLIRDHSYGGAHTGMLRGEVSWVNCGSWYDGAVYSKGRVPGRLQFQGRLLADDGTPMPGERRGLFSVNNEDGEYLWHREMDVVADDNGLFAVLAEETNKNDLADVFCNNTEHELFFGMAFKDGPSGEGSMTEVQRLPIVSVPYASCAAQLRRADSLTLAEGMNVQSNAFINRLEIGDVLHQSSLWIEGDMTVEGTVSVGTKLIFNHMSNDPGIDFHETVAIDETMDYEQGRLNLMRHKPVGEIQDLVTTYEKWYTAPADGFLMMNVDTKGFTYDQFIACVAADQDIHREDFHSHVAHYYAKNKASCRNTVSHLAWGNDERSGGLTIPLRKGDRLGFCLGRVEGNEPGGTVWVYDEVVSGLFSKTDVTLRDSWFVWFGEEE